MLYKNVYFYTGARVDDASVDVPHIECIGVLSYD